MNNQSPLIPQGSLLEQKNRGRARVKIAVFLVLAIHGIGLMALLMQGCKKPADTSSTETPPEPTNNAAPAFVEPTNAPPATNLVTAPTNTTSAASESAEQPPPAPPAAATDYVVVKGDTFSSISKKFRVSVKAILEANPSVEPTKLKIGQPIHIPAPVMAAASTSGGPVAGTTNDAATGSGQTYSVKSGDSLTKIAGDFGVTVRSLRSANNLKTDKIVVGQKLKIPAKTSTQTAAATPASAATSAPVAAPTGQ